MVVMLPVHKSSTHPWAGKSSAWIAGGPSQSGSYARPSGSQEVCEGLRSPLVFRRGSRGTSILFNLNMTN